MKKILTYICTAVCSLIIGFNAIVSAADMNTQKIKVFLNGEVINFESQEPAVVERRTLIPLRGIFEKMGYSVSWDAKTKSCTISNDIQTITMRSGHKGMQVNEQAYMLDVPAQIINKTLMIPLRAVAECTGATVTWDAPTKSVYINSNQKEQVTFTHNEYVSEYTNIIAELEDGENLFKTLNSLTDKNYNKKVDVLKRESEKAKESLNNVYEKLYELTPPKEYEDFHNLSLDAVYVSIDLCELVNTMAEGNLSYDEAKAEIEIINKRANEINSELREATIDLNLSLFR